MNKIQELYQSLKPFIAKDFSSGVIAAAAISGGGGLIVHGLNSGYHTGTLADSQAPQFLKTDGSRTLTGNLSVTPGVTFDGVDLSAHAANPDAHHPRLHGILSTADHFVSGLTAGQVLKATGSTTFAFQTIDHTELTGVTPNQHHNQQHAMTGSDHTHSGGAALDVFGLTATSTIGVLTPSSNPGAASAILKSASTGSLTLGTNMFQLDNSLKSLGLGVTPDGAAFLDIKAINTADHSVRIKQLASQTGRMWRVEDTSGNELVVIDSVGDLQSGQPGFVSGLTGWQITPQGNAEFNNGFFRGSLHATIFVVDEFHATGGTFMVATAGKLLNQWNINLSTGAEAIRDIRTTSVTGTGSQLDIRTTSVTGSGTKLTTRNLTNYLDIEDPVSGHAQMFLPGQILRLKSIGSISPGLDIYDVWLRVLYNEDMTTFWRYDVQIVAGGADTVVIPAGCAVISYGKKGDGRILLTADLNYAPYMDVFTSGDAPWAGDIIPHVRTGRLDGVGLPGISGVEQYGIVMGNNLSNANSSYIVASNLQLGLYRVDLTSYNGSNPTVSLTQQGRFKLGLDIQNPDTTVVDFDPLTGVYNLGSALYPAAVNIVGNVTITGGAGYANLTDAPTSLAALDSAADTKLTGIQAGATVGATWNSNVSGQPTSLSGINSTEGSKLAGIAAGATVGADWATNLSNRPTELTDGRIPVGLNSGGSVISKVLPGSNVGTPAGAGLYLGADKMGYYNGSAWKTYTDNTGKFFFAGNSGATLAWDGTDLYGTDGTNVQWYARASTGKLYAGAGNVQIDVNGVTLTNDTSDSYLTQANRNALTFYRTGTGTIGRVAGYYKSSTTQYGMDVYAMSPNSEAVVTTLQAIPQGTIYAGGAPGNSRLRLESGVTESAQLYSNTIQLYATGSATPSIEAVVNQVNIYDDLRVDGSTNHVMGIRTTS